ncbi:hypothetical protein Skr01_54340 [Sphaerisporangium krabiense]|uniref:Ribosomal protein S27AE n=1 Tax=Sphaerisporangium krabiense TaxID=763782 RepID=A0A7W8Z4D8_9ACTN|nr:protein DpdJ [Sphaerisporangium krabiense]MBB5627191.1 ribosomal protein S27AE [Sphaerisporangium krabiense]GII65349.1 hypothetical protein Skr01_54340 [Sphaerisporangium krabiense]
MKDALSREFAGQLLNALEDRELPLLAWGITDRALSEEEVRDVIFTVLGEQQPPLEMNVDDVLDELVDHALLFKLPATSPPRYRSRFAEALRLTANLRQLFDWRQRDGSFPHNWWSRGRPLVADYRIHTAKRRYPRRDIPVSQAVERFRSVANWGALQDAIAIAQIGNRQLSRFQVAATSAIYSSLSHDRSSGIIVGAGTSSGKTLSFYLPAFAAMAEAARPNRRSLHTLALYPRKELLRDQLRTAIATAADLTPRLARMKRRPLRVGALYADTPSKADALDMPNNMARRAWKQRDAGLVCPYLSCPKCPKGELLWTHADRKAGRELLKCVKCAYVIPDGALALTRKSLREQPPDLLFTTTEQLNRNSSNAGLGKLLGWTGHDVPRLVLLDEVHTYSGTQGAQVALLLRRWRHAIRRPVTFVGLSATLKDAGRFFAELTGLHDHTVEYVKPADDELEEEGREYSIALRSDPTSGASHLSTSIQTAMLLGRILDMEGQSLLYGSTGFLFTDDLDVTNRFYNNLRDAEGGQTRSGFRKRRKPVLAGLRAPNIPQWSERLRDGQSWDLIEKIGHTLDAELNMGDLRIGRTSSQDAGMDLNANLTVATASLEVGFDDPRVGLVLQHKAPYDAAAFIQRRGRAGRTRGTRPITIVTLSDYGRDRLSYQGYETLFAPELSARRLPIHNRYVLKIQATQSLLDWLAFTLRKQSSWDDPRYLLTAPIQQGDGRNPVAAEQLAGLLENLLNVQELQDNLAKHLAAALNITGEEAQALLWEEPRSLLLSVVPTSLRRLKTGWHGLRRDPGTAPHSMLPEFVTRSLFDPLNAPEVEFDLPFDTGSAEERLPIAKALREAVPGRVSRRYGVQRDEHRTWIPVPESGNALELTEALVPACVNEGIWHPQDHVFPNGIAVVRPYQLKLSEPLSEIADRSQGVPQWATEVRVPEGRDPYPGDVPLATAWRNRIRSIGFSTHAAGNPVEIRRMTYGAKCDIAVERHAGTDRRTVRYTLDGKPAALGFQLEVDAVRIELEPIDLHTDTIRKYLTSPTWRSQAFFRAVTEDQELATVTNSFKRAWLYLIYITAFSLAGLDGTRTPKEVRAALADGSWRNDLSKIFGVLYREDELESPAEVSSKLVAELIQLSHDPTVIATLERSSHLLTEDAVATMTADLARRSYRDTLAAAILAATLRACPDAQEQDLIIDVLPGTGMDSDVVWITETAIGGLGIIEKLVTEYAAAPEAFWSLVLDAMRPNAYEYTDGTVTRLLRNIVEEAPQGPAATAIAELRSAGSADQAAGALRKLRDAWTDLDGTPRHSAVATLSTRLLRPGSNPGTDRTTLRLLDGWSHLESRLGIEVDARVIAYAVGAGRMNVGRSGLSADQIFGMLWPRGFDARSQHLRHYQPYVDYEHPPVLDRLLLEKIVDEHLPRIDLTHPDWERAYQSSLGSDPLGAVELTCPASDSRRLGEVLRRVPALPVDRDVLRTYGEVTGVRRAAGLFVVRIELQEVAR